ncbi:hypothetical protein FNW02_31840 [Komarekiella sp. 'clone 1']|uniref:TonB C-terminal domain-containing protein n=1 Tax=Komarekiella delphini-convector SJRDD-AB1 TaxID=2593771 RepID=A0AA40T3I7_9NOST|nr:hypothetical protein [Komarekiella delphini-convector]MBD6620256.1 hypothetical protein [Komarekiella delphini-convector SJRDD-AB1]
MSNVSLLKNIPDILSQPIGIAAIASIGIHGAIALIVPLMPVDSSKPREAAKTTVGLLELSPTDQARLPQNPNTPQVALQQQLPQPGQVLPPNFSAQTVLPPLPPATSSQFTLPPLPQSLNNYRVSSLPTKQSVRMIPRVNLGFNAAGFNASGKFSSSAVPRLSDSDIKYEASKPLPVNKLPELQSQKIPDDILRNTQYPNLSEATSTTAVPGNTTPQTTPGDVSQIGQNQQQIAPIGQPLQGADNLALAGQSLPQLQPRTMLNTPELPSKAIEQAIAQVNSYEDLRKIVRQEYPNAEEKAVIRDIIPTDKPNLQGTVLGVLVVDPDGKVLDIKFQNKLLSPELQLKAREYFSTQPPKKEKQTSSYPFSLSFQNNSNTTGTTQATPKPLSELQNRNNQLAPLPAANPKPLPELRIRNNQPTPSSVVTPKPLSELQNRNNQLAPLPTGNPKPLLELRNRNNQPAATPKPLLELRNRSNQSAPSSAAKLKPLSVPTVNNNQSALSGESDQKLLEQLRQLKENREKSAQ